MSVVTNEQLALMAGVKVNDNMRSVATSLNRFGVKFGVDQPHRLAHYLAQLLHENGNFRYDREIASGAAYENRKDLGNTEPGDGIKFKGRTGIQITGRSNYRQFTAWCRKMGFDPPDFEEKPDLVNTDPWEGLGPLWYWSTRNLNALADKNDIESLTKRINGGLNGYVDRLAKYTRAALVLLGYQPDDVRSFQIAAQSAGFYPRTAAIDNDAGPKTRAALHMMLARSQGAADGPGEPAAAVAPSPVVAEHKEAVVPKGAEKRGGLWTAALAAMGSTVASVWGAIADMPLGVKVGVGVVAILGIGFMLLRGELVVRRVKAIVAEIES